LWPQGEFTYRDTKGHELTRLRGEVLDHVFNQYLPPNNTLPAI
jgi:hypothetical protein